MRVFTLIDSFITDPRTNERANRRTYKSNCKVACPQLKHVFQRFHRFPPFRHPNTHHRKIIVGHFKYAIVNTLATNGLLMLGNPRVRCPLLAAIIFLLLIKAWTTLCITASLFVGFSWAEDDPGPRPRTAATFKPIRSRPVAIEKNGLG